MVAVQHGFSRAVTVLMKAKPNVNIQDEVKIARRVKYIQYSRYFLPGCNFHVFRDQVQSTKISL